MSYAFALKNIPDLLSQPTGIAVLASVGIHGAIAFILPLVPVESKSQVENSPKTVGVVELNQAEQSRLPQTGTPQVTQPQLPLQSQLTLPSQVPAFPDFANQTTVLPPLPSAPPASETSLPPLALSPNNLNIVSLPKNQYVRIPQGRDLTVQRNLGIRDNFNASIPRVDYGEVRNLESQVQLGESQPLPSSNISSRPSPSELPELQAANLPANLPSYQPPITSNTNTTPRVVKPQEFIAPVGRTPEAGEQLALAGQSLPQWQQKPQVKIPELQIAAKTSTTPTTSATSQQTEQLLAKTTTFAEQFLKIREQYPNIETQKPISETLNAQKGQEGEVEGALVVDSQGKVETIDFLDNSVSSEMKTATREFFREYFQKNPISNEGRPKYYPFSLSFNSNSNTTPTAGSKLQPLEIRNTQQPSNQQQDLRQRLRSPQNNTSSSEQLQEVKPTSQSNLGKSPAELLRIRTNQTTPTPQATTKPSQQLQQVRTNQPAVSIPEMTATPKPLSQQQLSNNQFEESTGNESNKVLVEKLRQVKNERQNP